MLPKEVLEHVIRINSSAEEAAKIIIEYQNRRDTVNSRKIKAQKIMDEAKKKVEKLMSEEICKHEITKTHGDPSGGSDSEEQCLICNEYISRKEVRFT